MSAEEAQKIGEELERWLKSGQWHDVRSLCNLARDSKGPVHGWKDYLDWDVERQANAWALSATNALLRAIEVRYGEGWTRAFPLFPQEMNEVEDELAEVARSLRQVVKLPREVTEENIWAKAEEDLKHIKGRLERWAEYAEVLPFLGEFIEAVDKFARRFEGQRPLMMTDQGPWPKQE